MRWTSGEVALELTNTHVGLRAPGVARTVTRDAFAGGALDGACCERLGLVALVEARAVVAHGALPSCEPPVGRPRVARVFGFGGRGSVAPGAWILGRVVRTSVGARDLAFADVLAHGVPADAGLPSALAAAVHAAVTVLDPLPCFCGTGAETPEQHGTIERLAGPIQDPRAPITCEATVGRCRVCGRCWVFERMGDSHYDFQERATPFRGPS